MLCFGTRSVKVAFIVMSVRYDYEGCHFKNILYVLHTVETVGVEISLAAMALSVVLGGVFLLSRRFMSDARRVSVDCGC